MKLKPLLGLAVMVLCAAVTTAGAGEWTTWRGTSYHGTSPETDLIDHWSPEGENLIWKDPDFIGRSTPVVLDGQVCANGRVGEGRDREEIVACWDAETGARRWEHRFSVYNTTVPFNRVGWASLVADPDTGYIYAHGVAGQLYAYDRDGHIVWSYFLTEEFGQLTGYGGRTQTPIIDGDQLLLTIVTSGWGSDARPSHRYFSFDKRTGEVLWISTPGGFPKDMNTQSAPVVAEMEGQRLLVAGNADGNIYAVQIETGKKVWEYKLSKRGINSTVLVVGNTVFASHSEENLDDATMGRLVAFEVSGSGDQSGNNRWQIDELSAGFPSPAYLDGTLYVVDNSANLYAIDGGTGEVHWTYALGTVGKGSPLLADGKMYVTETNGRFHILRLGPDGAESLSVHELEVADGRYAEIYGSPAIANGRIYFTTEGGIYCIGDPDHKPKASRRKASKPKKLKSYSGDAASIRVVPAEVLISPGETVQFHVRAFDEQGRLLGVVTDPDWDLEQLPGMIDDEGLFESNSVKQFQAGMVSASVGGVKGAARVRVIGPAPWYDSFDDYAEGSVPPTWIGAGGKFKVEEKNGNMLLTKTFRPRGLLRNALYTGPSSMTNYTIQADLMGGQKKRRKADIGLINGGYTMDLQGNRQKLQVRTWPAEERIAQDVEFEWDPNTWYRMKLRVDVTEEKAIIRGKVWPSAEREPRDWTIVVEDDHPIRSGSPGLIGYSPVDIYYDNLRVTVND